MEQNFAHLKNGTQSIAKTIFGKVWAALASKRVRFVDGEIFMSWRPLSAELAKIFNEWFNATFTTDAFLKAFNPDSPVGIDNEFDNVIMNIVKSSGCIGIFKVKMGPSISTQTKTHVFSEINVITGEEIFYTQNVEHGRLVGIPTRISAKEFETICYSTR